MKCSLKQIAQLVGGTIHGDETAELSGIASLQSAGELDLVFVDKEEKLAEALNSRAGALIAGSFCKPGESRKPIILVANPRLAFARAAELLTTAAEYPPGIHASAVIGTNVSLGADVSIESHVFIGDDVVVGKGTRIGAGASIDRGTRIGTKCNIHANVSIYPGVTIGHNVIVHAGATLGSDGFGYVRDETTGRYYKFPQIGRLIIEDDVEIGANSTVDRGALDETRIGQGTKIDNLVHVGHNVTIGKDVVIAAQTGLSGSSTVESDVVIGGQVGIADHVRIESGAILGAQSGIPTRKIIRGKGVVFWGTPARPIRDYLKELAVLAKLARK